MDTKENTRVPVACAFLLNTVFLFFPPDERHTSRWVMSTSDYLNAIPVCGLGQEAVLWDIKTGALPLWLLKTQLRARHLLGGELQRAKCGTCEEAQAPATS